jgi:quercetin dioxygenase-like cupin family protein
VKARRSVFTMADTPRNYAPIPPDNPDREAVIARADSEQALHIGVVGDTYTVLLSGPQTSGRFCAFDMHIPPGGGPAPHRHDFEETFTMLEGELLVTFRGKEVTLRAGDTLHVPANAPHQIHNASEAPVRCLCICSPAGQEDFFREVGVLVATRTTAPPPLDEAGQKAFIEKGMALAPKYRTEILAP